MLFGPLVIRSVDDSEVETASKSSLPLIKGVDSVQTLLVSVIRRTGSQIKIFGFLRASFLHFRCADD